MNKQLNVEKEDDLTDPLLILLTWGYDTRQKVADALKPYCYLVGRPDAMENNGEIRFYNSIESDDLRDKVFLLAYAAQYELGFRRDKRLTEEEANRMAGEIMSHPAPQQGAE
jgi:hypothetical protein